MIWYMRGSISLDDAMMLSQADREVINEVIKHNIDMVKQTGLPLL